MAGFLKGGKFKPMVATEETETTEKVAAPTIGGKPSPFGKKKLGALNKTVAPVEEVNEPKELDLDEQYKEEEELKAEKPITPSIKPSLGKKKLGGLKKEETTSEPIETEETVEATIEQKEEIVEQSTEKESVSTDEPNTNVTTEEQPKKSKKRGTKKKNTEVSETIKVEEVDESKRISLEEADSVMRQIVAPTTAMWEQEKNDVLSALKAIKVEQDMNMDQIKFSLAELDDIYFEVLPKQHDVESIYNGTKQNYDAVKSLAIAKSAATNSDARKAEAFIACKNYVTPNGSVVDLHQYMLLIDEKHKFYQKISEGIEFKKYSLINYNNVLKMEK